MELPTNSVIIATPKPESPFHDGAGVHRTGATFFVEFYRSTA